MPSKTTIAGIASGVLIALLPFIGSEPLSWPRAAVLISVALSVAAIGVFARDGVKAPAAVTDPDPAPPRIIPGGGNEADS